MLKNALNFINLLILNSKIITLFEISQAYEEEGFYKFLLDMKILKDVNKLCQSIIEKLYCTLCSSSDFKNNMLGYYEMIYTDLSGEFKSTYGIYFQLIVTKYGIRS